MPICELCSTNEAFKRFEIVDSHIFSKFKTVMWLCKWCYEDLRKYGVSLKEVYLAEPKHERIEVSSSSSVYSSTLLCSASEQKK